MVIRRLSPLLFSAIVLVILSASTCKKPLVCTGDCYTLNISGTTLEALSGIPVAKVPMTLYRGNRPGGSLISIRRKVIDFNSDETGTIRTTAEIDTSALRNGYFFYAEVPDNPDWVMPLDDRAELYDVTQSPFLDYRPKVYHRGNLILQLKREIPTDFTAFTVAIHYADFRSVYAWSVASPKDLTETQKTMPTATNVWTHIDISRTDANGSSTLKQDSVFLPNNTPVTYIVKY